MNAAKPRQKVSRNIPVVDQEWTTIEDDYVDWREQDHLFRQSPLRESTRTINRPINEFDALLRCAPGDEPMETLADAQVLREAVVDAIDALGEQDRFIIEAIHSERVPVRELAERLGLKSKGHVHRLIKAAEQALREELLKSPLILERLNP